MNKIEQVARAICVAAGYGVGDEDWPVYVVHARAAIEAMREPTDDMFVVGDEKIIETLHDHTFALSGLTPSVKCWQAMIDAALNEE